MYEIRLAGRVLVAKKRSYKRLAGRLELDPLSNRRKNVPSDKPYYITLKLEPAQGEALRAQYEDIVPGYYMNKMHWNSIKPDGAVPDDLLKDMLDRSYELVLGGFSKKRQREILDA